jgi:hypothetical protein
LSNKDEGQKILSEEDLSKETNEENFGFVLGPS